MDNTFASDYDRLLAQVNEDVGSEIQDRDVEKEIRIMFEDTDMGRQLDINEWDVVFENDNWMVVADSGAQWSVTETEDMEHPFQFEAVSETVEEGTVDEEEGALKGKMDDLYAKAGKGRDKEEGAEGDEEQLKGGVADGVDDSAFDPEQLRMGQHHELEHTNNPAVAMEIAKDHLREDPIYYTKLKNGSGRV